MIESSIPAVLEDRARQQPDDFAFTFIEYEVDPAGFAESLTWSQVRQRARVVVEELSVCGSAGGRGRVAVISIPDDRSEQLVTIVELKKRGSSEGEGLHGLHNIKREVTSAISRFHSLRVADLVMVAPDSIPITTSGKVRRAACAERYRQNEFARLDTL